MKIKNHLLSLLAAVSIVFITGCAETSTDAEPGAIEVWGPTAYDDLTTEKQYNSGDSFDYETLFDTDVTFTIKNTGSGDLTISNLPLSPSGGQDPQEFIISQQPDSPIKSGDETTLFVQYTGDIYFEEADIIIESDDPDLSSFTLSLIGYNC